MTYSWLLSPLVQIQDRNGLPVVGGKVYVYDADTENLATIYADDTGTTLSNPVLTDTLGNVTLFGETGVLYDIAVYDSTDLLLFAKKHVQPGTEGGGGTTTIDINAGNGCIVSKNGNIFTISVDFDAVASQADLALKQDKLNAGNNIEITNQNVINVTGRRAIVTQEPIVSNMSDNAWVVSFDYNAFIGAKGIMVKPELELDPTSSKYIGYNGIPFGDSDVSNLVASAQDLYNTKLDKSFSSEFYPMTGNPSGFLASGLLIPSAETNIFASAGNVVIASQSFPKTGTMHLGNNDYTTTANCVGSSFQVKYNYSNVEISPIGVEYNQAPSVIMSASWNNILTKALEPTPIKPNVSALDSWSQGMCNLELSSVSGFKVLTFITPSYGAYDEYSAQFFDGGSMQYRLEIPSGCMNDVYQVNYEGTNRWCRRVWDNDRKCWFLITF